MLAASLSPACLLQPGAGEHIIIIIITITIITIYHDYYYCYNNNYEKYFLSYDLWVGPWDDLSSGRVKMKDMLEMRNPR